MVKYFGLNNWQYHYFRDDSVREVLEKFYEDMCHKIEYAINQYEKYLNSLYIIEDESNFDNKHFHSKKVNCPVCNKKINKFFKSFSRCPKCGWIPIKSNTIILD